ncbi:MAG: glycoside hydrolase family 127 protein, partial [Candidatus Aminicenantes bacterium]|nr:glycoside hydrolase family 127 protein [Candidatus Aminicenantes bacterium]
MKKSIFFLLITLLFFTNSNCKRGQRADYPISPVPFTDVGINDSFWLPRMETNRFVTIPFAMNKNEETGRVNNLRIAAGLMEGKYIGRRFNDTDVFKVMEGAAYSLKIHPDPDLEKQLDDLISVIAAAQEEDGYLYAARTADPVHPAPGAGPERWSRLRGSHELYNAGHMYEAAVAHYQATGKKSFLDIAVKNADMLVRTFGPGKRRDVPGHQEIEIGLARLYRTTGNPKYLELARFFLDERGREHDGGLYDEGSPFAIYNGREYMQDHKPVLEQEEAVGHAVRATYMYAGMADVAALGNNPEYISAIDRLWDNTVSKKLYITGGVGARHTSEAFGDAYELPNSTAYTETCAAVGNAFWNHRMFLLHGEGRYID